MLCSSSISSVFILLLSIYLIIVDEYTMYSWQPPIFRCITSKCKLSRWRHKIRILLEQRWYKNESTETRWMFVLNLPPCFPHRIAEWNSAPNSKQTFIWSPSIRSYIILALILRTSVQQGWTRLTRLRNELYSDSFHAMLALSQCSISTRDWNGWCLFQKKAKVLER